VEGDDGFGYATGDIGQGLTDRCSERKLIANPGVDHVFEVFENGVAGDESSHALGKHDLGPVFGTDVVGGVDHPEGFFLFGGGYYHGISHRVVGAGEGDVLGVLGNVFTEALLEFFFECGTNRDNRNLNSLE